MKKRIISSLTGLLAVALIGMMPGCSRSVSVFPEAGEGSGAGETAEESEQGTDPDDSGKAGTGQNAAGETDSGTGQEAGESSGAEEDSGRSRESLGTDTADEADAASRGSEPDQEAGLIYVDVAGAVCSPGVYTLPEGSRVFQAIEKAGGFADNADRESMNQAGRLEDGQQIRVYTREEAELLKAQGQVPQTVSSGGSALEGDLQTSDSGNGTDGGGKVNLNTADKEELMTLTGIGETRAEAILAYREENGGFRTPEDLMQVEGIKEKTYEKLKDQITVD